MKKNKQRILLVDDNKNTEVISSSELLSKLAKLQDKYIKMLGKELDEIYPIAHTHGWRSKYVSQGERLRDQIKETEKLLR